MSVQGVSVGSPFRYALVYVGRSLHDNGATYVALGLAVALPTLAMVLRTTISAQGARLGGQELAGEFETAATMISGLAALVGILHISLLLGRALATRAAEYKLLEAIVMSRSKLLQVALWESGFHAAFGWSLGSTLAAVTFGAGMLWADFPMPASDAVGAAATLGLAICVVSAFVPGLAIHLRRLRRLTPEGS